jgi:hypothetical protein
MPDSFESRMNSIIERRTKFRADMGLLKERQAETREMIRHLVDVKRGRSVNAAKKPIAALANSGPAPTDASASWQEQGRTRKGAWMR